MPKIHRTTLATRIKAWRARMGWTQQQAAEALGMARTSYVELEKSGCDQRTALAMAALQAGLEPID